MITAVEEKREQENQKKQQQVGKSIQVQQEKLGTD